MKVTTGLAAVATTAVLGSAGFMLPAIASAHSTPLSSAHSATHTLSFTSVTKKQHGFSKKNFGQSDLDVNKGGKVIGFDELNLTYDPSTKGESGGVTFDTTGGFMYLTLTIGPGNNGAITGKVTGGTGVFKNATGSLVAHNLNKKGTRTAVTITYKN